jgi:hypothetical protein
VTDSNSTLIDHVYVNRSENSKATLVLKCALSDHCHTFICRKMNGRNSTQKHKTVTHRSFKSCDEASYTRDLEQVPWSLLDMYDDASEALATWMAMFMKVTDEHAPIRERRVKHPTQPEWMWEEIQAAMATRDRFKSAGDGVNATIWRNKVRRLTEDAQSTTFILLIENNKGDSSALWQYLRELVPTAKSKKPNCPNDGDTVISDPVEIADESNRYCTTVAESLAKHTFDTGDSSECQYTDLHDFVDSSVPDGTEFDIPPMTDEFVLRELRSLSPKKATGLDGVSARLLKAAAGEIAPSLTKVFNLSISTNVFPSQWKLAKVVPIHKGGPLVDVNNFRPISILPVM